MKPVLGAIIHNTFCLLDRYDTTNKCWHPFLIAVISVNKCLHLNQVQTFSSNTKKKKPTNINRLSKSYSFFYYYSLPVLNAFKVNVPTVC